MIIFLLKDFFKIFQYTMAGGEIKYPQIAIFTLLVVIVVWLLSKNVILSVFAGLVIYGFSLNGYFENIGIGTGDCDVCNIIDSPGLK
jgi:branched-subunit amino acid transport protein AzlD